MREFLYQLVSSSLVKSTLIALIGFASAAGIAGGSNDSPENDVEMTYEEKAEKADSIIEKTWSFLEQPISVAEQITAILFGDENEEDIGGSLPEQGTEEGAVEEPVDSENIVTGSEIIEDVKDGVKTAGDAYVGFWEYLYDLSPRSLDPMLEKVPNTDTSNCGNGILPRMFRDALVEYETYKEWDTEFDFSEPTETEEEPDGEETP